LLSNRGRARCVQWQRSATQTSRPGAGAQARKEDSRRARAVSAAAGEGGAPARGLAKAGGGVEHVGGGHNGVRRVELRAEVGGRVVRVHEVAVDHGDPLGTVELDVLANLPLALRPRLVERREQIVGLLSLVHRVGVAAPRGRGRGAGCGTAGGGTSIRSASNSSSSLSILRRVSSISCHAWHAREERVGGAHIKSWLAGGSLSREVSRAEIGPKRTFSSIGDRSMPPRRQSAPAPSASGAASADPCARSAAHRPLIMRSTPAPAPTPEMDAHARSTMIAAHRPGRRSVQCVHNEPAPFMSAARSMAPAVFRFHLFVKLANRFREGERQPLAPRPETTL